MIKFFFSREELDKEKFEKTFFEILINSFTINKKQNFTIKSVL